MIRILWKKYFEGYTDIFQSKYFTQLKRNDAVVDEHQVINSKHQNVGSARYTLTVKNNHVFLDYLTHERFNTKQNMDIGFTRVRFVDKLFKTIEGVDWKGVGDKKYTLDCASVKILKERVPKLKPYEFSQNKPKRRLSDIAHRPHQTKFRNSLKEAYGIKCLISGCDVDEALEAAHIDTFSKHNSNHPQNGLLLRRDLHALFDKGLIGIDPKTRIIPIAKDVSSWAGYNNISAKTKLIEPKPDFKNYRPSENALGRRWQDFCKKNGKIEVIKDNK